VESSRRRGDFLLLRITVLLRKCIIEQGSASTGSNSNHDDQHHGDDGGGTAAWIERSDERRRSPPAATIETLELAVCPSLLECGSLPCWFCTETCPGPWLRRPWPGGRRRGRHSGTSSTRTVPGPAAVGAPLQRHSNTNSFASSSLLRPSRTPRSAVRPFVDPGGFNNHNNGSSGPKTARRRRLPVSKFGTAQAPRTTGGGTAQRRKRRRTPRGRLARSVKNPDSRLRGTATTTPRI
jgi:hypothetical protein